MCVFVCIDVHVSICTFLNILSNVSLSTASKSAIDLRNPALSVYIFEVFSFIFSVSSSMRHKLPLDTVVGSVGDIFN